MNITCRVKKGKEFPVSSETEEDLLDIEREYGIDLHKTWHTHVPQDLLVVWIDCFLHM